MIRNVKELFRFRALVWALTGRHLRARYRGSALGFIWSFLNPLCLMAVYSLVLRSYIRFETGESYPIFLLTGLLPWIWFSSAVVESTASISSGGNLITKALFPPQILPTVSVFTHFANYLFALPILLFFLMIYDHPLHLSLLSLPIILFIQLLMTVGLSYLFSALNVFFRDIQHILANVLTLLFFLTPVIYPLSSVPARQQRYMLILNPLTNLMEMYRGVVLQGRFPTLLSVLWIGSISLLIFIFGSLVFNYYREQFAEYV